MVTLIASCTVLYNQLHRWSHQHPTLTICPLLDGLSLRFNAIFAADWSNCSFFEPCTFCALFSIHLCLLFPSHVCWCFLNLSRQGIALSLFHPLVYLFVGWLFGILLLVICFLAIYTYAFHVFSVLSFRSIDFVGGVDSISVSCQYLFGLSTSIGLSILCSGIFMCLFIYFITLPVSLCRSMSYCSPRLLYICFTLHPTVGVFDVSFNTLAKGPLQSNCRILYWKL